MKSSMNPSSPRPNYAIGAARDPLRRAKRSARVSTCRDTDRRSPERALSMKPSLARIPVKLHKNVTLVRTDRSACSPKSCWRGSAGALGGGQTVRHGAAGAAGRIGARDRRAAPAGPHAPDRGSEGLTEMPQASQSPTSPRPDERRRRLAAAPFRPRASPRFSCRPGPIQRDPPGRDPAGPGRHAGWLPDPPRRQCRRDHRTPGRAGGRAGPGRPLGARIAPRIEPLWPHRIDLVLGGRAFPRAANPGVRAGPAILPLLELGLLAVDPEQDSGPGRRIRRDPRVARPVAGVPAGSPGGSQERAHQRAREASCRAPPGRSARSANRTGSRRSSGWRPSGSASVPSRCGRPSKAFSTSATATGSTLTPFSPPRSPTHSSRCPIHPRCGWPWPGESG